MKKKDVGKFWVFTLPDNSKVQTTLPDTLETKIELLEVWCESRCTPYKRMKATATAKLLGLEDKKQS